jgi:flagellar hook assembly protein FlgD
VKATDIKVYPNPVKDVANISFKMNKRSDVKVTIYDINGNVVKSILQKNINAGNQTIQFSTNGLSAGTYIAGMEMNGTRNTVKFVIN